MKYTVEISDIQQATLEWLTDECNRVAALNGSPAITNADMMLSVVSAKLYLAQQQVAASNRISDINAQIAALQASKSLLQAV